MNAVGGPEASFARDCRKKKKKMQGEICSSARREKCKVRIGCISTNIQDSFKPS